MVWNNVSVFISRSIYSNPIFLILCYMLFLFLNEFGMEIHTYMYLHFLCDGIVNNMNAVV